MKKLLLLFIVVSAFSRTNYTDSTLDSKSVGTGIALFDSAAWYREHAGIAWKKIGKYSDTSGYSEVSHRADTLPTLSDSLDVIRGLIQYAVDSAKASSYGSIHSHDDNHMLTIPTGTSYTKINSFDQKGDSLSGVPIKVHKSNIAEIIGAQPLDADLSNYSALSSEGIVVRRSTSATTRKIAVSGLGLSTTNADGVNGDPTVVLAAGTYEQTISKPSNYVLRVQSDGTGADTTNIYCGTGKWGFGVTADSAITSTSLHLTTNAKIDRNITAGRRAYTDTVVSTADYSPLNIGRGCFGGYSPVSIDPGHGQDVFLGDPDGIGYTYSRGAHYFGEVSKLRILRRTPGVYGVETGFDGSDTSQLRITNTESGAIFHHNKLVEFTDTVKAKYIETSTGITGGRGWFLATTEGFSPEITDTVWYSKIGRQVTLTFSSGFHGTSNSDVFRIFLPSDICPAAPGHYVNACCNMAGAYYNNGSVAYANVTTVIAPFSNYVQFYLNGGSLYWTTS